MKRVAATWLLFILVAAFCVEACREPRSAERPQGSPVETPHAGNVARNQQPTGQAAAIVHADSDLAPTKDTYRAERVHSLGIAHRVTFVIRDDSFHLTSVVVNGRSAPGQVSPLCTLILRGTLQLDYEGEGGLLACVGSRGLLRARDSLSKELRGRVSSPPGEYVLTVQPDMDAALVVTLRVRVREHQ